MRNMESRGTVTEWYDALAMNKVIDRVWLGNHYNASQLVQWNPHGITAVLDVSDSPVYDEHISIKYKHIPFPDGSEIPEKCFWDSMLFLQEAYRNSETLLVHCAAGISRSPTIVASFMTYHLGWEFDKALQWVQKVRTVVTPAVAVRVSAKKHLRQYPYDGTYNSTAPQEEFTWMSADRALVMHPNESCPLRKFFLIANKLGAKENAPRYTIPCTCFRKC